MSKNLFALENDQDTGEVLDETAITPEEGEVTDVLVDTDAGLGEVTEVADAIEGGVTADEEMTEVQDLVATAAEEGEGLPAVAAEAIRLNVQTICSRIGADPKSVYALYATENFASPSSRKANTQIALEGVSEFLKDLWKRLKAALNKLWEKAKAFWENHVSTLGRVKKALESAKTKVKASSGKLKGQAFVEKAPSSLVSAFAGKGDLDVKRVQSYIDAQKQLQASSTFIASAIGTLNVDFSSAEKVASAMAACAKAGEKAPKDVLVVGGEKLSIKLDAGEDGKTVKMEVVKEAITEKDAEQGMVVADKSGLTSVLDGALNVVKDAIAARKAAEKGDAESREILNKLEGFINKASEEASGEDKAAMRAAMNTLYRINALSAKVQGVYTSQNVRLAKGVLGFVGYSLKQYK